MEQQLKQIGKRIAICRKNLDLSQKDFASKLNIQIIIFQILKMVNCAKFHVVYGYLFWLNVNIEYIATGRVYPDLDKEIIEKNKKVFRWR